jgi:hypothetical protein
MAQGNVNERTRKRVVVGHPASFNPATRAVSREGDPKRPVGERAPKQ